MVTLNQDFDTLYWVRYNTSIRDNLLLSSKDNITSYKNISSAETLQYQYFEDALTVCCICDLSPEQAVKEFCEEFKKSPPPLYFKWWRNCWDEFDITPGMVREWLEKCDRLGWSERLGGEL